MILFVVVYNDSKV